jgi:lysophospholipase L1-like esterase
MLVIVMLLSGCSGGSENSTQNNNIHSSIPLRVACVGDSITEGFKLANPSLESYPAQLSNLVADGVDVQNFGIRGRSVIKAGEQSYWDSEIYQQSLAYNPEVVVIMLGSNDMKDANFAHRDSIVADYKALIESYKVLSSKPTIYICLPTPSYGTIRGITNKRIIDILIPKIQEVAKQTSVNIIDMHTLLSNKKELFPDTLHPNVAGAKIMAEHVYQTIY